MEGCGKMPYDMGRPGLHRAWEIGGKWMLPAGIGTWAGAKSCAVIDGLIRAIGVNGIDQASQNARDIVDFLGALAVGYGLTRLGNYLANEAEKAYYASEGSIRRTARQYITDDIEFRNRVNNIAHPEHPVQTLPEDYLRSQIIEDQ